MKKIILLFFILTATIFSSQKPLIVGMELAYPPFEMTDKEGNPAGFSVEMAKDLGEYLGREVNIVNMAYGGLIPSLKTKKIDIILSSMTITEERKKSISFSEPYAISQPSLLVNLKSQIDKPADLNQKGKKIAVKKGTTGHTIALEYFPLAEILVFDKESIAVLEVTQGKADAFIYGPLTILKNWEANKNTTKPILDPIKSTYDYWGIGYRHEDKELGEKINVFLKEYRSSEKFSALVDKYLSAEKKAYEERNIPFFF